MSLHKLFAGISAAIVAVALIWGFVYVGSPTTERSRKFDERRVQDIQTIQNEIRTYVYEGKQWDADAKPAKAVPASLADVAAQATYQKVNTTDPETGSLYEYVVTSPTTYDVCATFNEIFDQPYSVTWNHPAGSYCFHFDVTKDVPTAVPVDKRL